MSEFSSVSYAIAGIGFAVLALKLCTSWRDGKVYVYFLVACLISCLWAVVHTLAPGGDLSMSAVITDILRLAGWSALLLSMIAHLGAGSRIRYSNYTIFIAVLVTAVLLLLGSGLIGDPVEFATRLEPVGMFMSLIGLVLVEQFYRNISTDLAHRMKGMALGLAAVFAYDFVLYTLLLIGSGLSEPMLSARGTVNVLALPLIGSAAMRNYGWDPKLVVSRQMVFYSASLIAVGIYLLLMTLGGYAIVSYGGNWGGIALIVFLSGAVLLLFALLSSRRLRARARVFLNKHFFHNKYDYREEWLRLVTTLGGFQDTSTRQVVIKAIAQIANSPGGVLWVYDENKKSYEIVASYNYSDKADAFAVADPLIDFIKREHWLIDLEELRDNPTLYNYLEIPEWLAEDEEAWLIVPLMLRQDLFGLVMLVKSPGVRSINFEDRDLLKTVGNHVAVHLAQEESDKRLAEAKQFETYNRLTAFLMHDLNNLIAQQSLIIRNAETHRRNPEFIDDAIGTIANSVERMRGVMGQLKRRASDRPVQVRDLEPIVSAAIQRCASGQPKPTAAVEPLESGIRTDVEQLTMTLVNLIKNAQDSTAADGSIEINAKELNGDIRIEIADTGAGMTSEFIRTRLFRPFDTTKGSQGMGIGAYQAREFARRFGGQLTVESEVKKGTVFTITLPAAKSSASDAR